MLRQYFPDKNKFLALSMAVGRVVRKGVNERAAVSVNLHRMNDYLCIYFPEKSTLEVSDPDNKCDVGDIVLIRKLPEVQRYIETHKVERIIHKVGAVIDPITGMRVEGDVYIPNSSTDSEAREELTREVSPREFIPKYSYEIDPNAYKWESRNLKRKDSD